MSVKKITLPNGEIKWEARSYKEGRGSSQIRRRFDRRIEAEEFLHRLETEKRNAAVGLPSAILQKERLFEEEAQYWLEETRNRFSPGHLIRTSGILKQILPVLGSRPVLSITPEVLLKIQSSMMNDDYKPASINRVTEVIMAILNNSVRHKRIAHNPASGYRKFRRKTTEMAFWSQEEARDFLRFTDRLYPVGSEKRWVHVVYLLALNTGLRAGEIWGLKPIDLGQDAQSIMIRRQYHRILNDYSQPKGNRPRVVPCNGELLRELRTHITQRKVKPDQPIFSNSKGRPICHDNFLYRSFYADEEKWGGRKIRFHDLRHTAATLMLHAGVDIRTVKEICGHSEISTTMNYLHLMPGSIERVSQTFSVSGIGKDGEN